MLDEKPVSCTDCGATFWVHTHALADGLANGTYRAAERYVRKPDAPEFMLDRYVAGLCFRCCAPEMRPSIELQMAKVNRRRTELEAAGLDRENAIEQAVREQVDSYDRAYHPQFARYLAGRVLPPPLPLGDGWVPPLLAGSPTH